MPKANPVTPGVGLASAQGCSFDTDGSGFGWPHFGRSVLDCIKADFPTHEKVPLAACSMFQDPQKLKICTLLHQSKLNICSSSSSKRKWPKEPAEVLADAFIDAAGPRPKLQTTDGVKTTIEQALQAAVKKA